MALKSLSQQRWRTGAAMALPAAAAFLMAGCSGPSPAETNTSASMPSTLSSAPPPASPDNSAKTKALAAYRGMWQDFVAAGQSSDWQSPTLGQYATGVALTNLSRGLYADHYNGLVTKGAPVLNPSVTSEDPVDNPKKVVVADCGDSTHWLKYRADNGQLADNKPGGRQQVNAVVEKQSDSSWKVTDYGVHDVGTC
ncbi:hypothetical protein [Amycolatopsis sp. H20-H5]|uniref:hypothetical protein n=1 Tax=Amycolatopsis sp. H20-H5 TaxID=3046309 RepID=UPI002DB80BBB|nr:hypothetical protein [Amycolatopsis sp. H20-H5]MEC3978896.1 hypothetical protein [Amycolatopsis sp. H20-H5]